MMKLTILRFLYIGEYPPEQISQKIRGWRWSAHISIEYKSRMITESTNSFEL